MSKQTSTSTPYLGSAEITESLSKIIKFKVITATNQEDIAKFLATLPTQEDLLKKLTCKGFDPEKVYELSKKDATIPQQLIDFGLEISSLRKAGVSPSSLLGLEYIVRGPAYDENGDVYFTQEHVRHHIDESYLVTSLGFTPDELLNDGLYIT